MRLSPARLLLRVVLPADERDDIIAELDETRALKFPAGGLRARLWYWRQAFSFSRHFLPERTRDRAPHAVAPRASGPQLALPDLRNRKDRIMRGTLRDIGFAVRQLVKQPGFALAVVLTLALGIGPNTAIFSVVNGVLLRPLPYQDPEELALLRVDLSSLRQHPGLARAEVVDFGERAELLEDVGSVTREYTTNITTEGDMEAVLAANVSPNLFPLLGIEPVVGRQFTAEEGMVPPPDAADGASSTPVAILSYRLWQRRFAGDPEVINQTIELNNSQVPIAGVMPEGFRLLLGPGTSLSPDVDIWRPLVLDSTDRGFWAYRTIARLADGATFAQAQAEVSAIGESLVQEFPQAYEGADIRYYVHPLHSDLVQNVRPAILALLGAVSLVLLIACTNAASLLLARTKTREKEIAMRAALGAGRARIMRQVLTESVVLALLAGLVGLLLGAFGLDTLLALQPGDLPRADGIGLDPAVLAFTFGASFLAALLFGVIPAWQASRPQLNDVLKEGRRGGGGLRARTRSGLVVAQVAFSVMLLIGAGLLIRSFVSLSGVDLGFDPDHVVTMQVPIDTDVFRQPEDRWGIYRQLEERITALPGVRAAGAISILPLSNQNMMASYSPDLTLDTTSNWNGTSADYRFVTPGYFDAMGVTLLAGRGFEERDNEALLPLAIVDETLAREGWPDGNAVGQRLQIGLGTQLNRDDQDGEDTLGNNMVEIIGVVSHSRGIDVRRQVRPQIYLPYRLGPSQNNIFAVRTAGDVAGIVSLIRREAEELGTGRPIHGVRTMDEYVGAAMGGTRFTLILMGALAAIALLLSTIGIYSLIAFTVRSQAHETGIRIALGALPSAIVWKSVRQGLLLALLGLPLGLAGAAFLARFIEGLLYGVSPTDAATYVGIPLLLLGVALAASLIPARRATRVDPLVALRSE
ncbi:MAG: ABC transporter permease [Acidobacteriota bacterium]|jgi:putative ABC transport system permease protein